MRLREGQLQTLVMRWQRDTVADAQDGPQRACPRIALSSVGITNHVYNITVTCVPHLNALTTHLPHPHPLPFLSPSYTSPPLLPSSPPSFSFFMDPTVNFTIAYYRTHCHAQLTRIICNRNRKETLLFTVKQLINNRKTQETLRFYN